MDPSFREQKIFDTYRNILAYFVILLNQLLNLRSPFLS